jgi:hypothetical protein
MLLLLAMLSTGTACSSTKLLLTTDLSIRADSKFNDGFILPVDIVYIPKDETPDTILGISPDDWFDSPERENWPHIQTLSFRETDLRETTKITLKKAKETTAMIVIADYRGLSGPKGQMVLFDAESKEHEDIFITSNGLHH